MEKNFRTTILTVTLGFAVLAVLTRILVDIHRAGQAGAEGVTTVAFAPEELL